MNCFGSENLMRDDSEHRDNHRERWESALTRDPIGTGRANLSSYQHQLFPARDVWKAEGRNYSTIFGNDESSQRNLPLLKKNFSSVPDKADTSVFNSSSTESSVTSPSSRSFSPRDLRHEHAEMNQDFFATCDTTSTADRSFRFPIKAAARSETSGSYDRSRMPPPSFSVPRTPAASPVKVCGPGETVNVWNGNLPPRNARESSFSCKVFLGGVPWDVTEGDVIAAFGKFGGLRVEWPGIHDTKSSQIPKGHLYIIFANETSVRFLLGSCSYDFHHGQHNWFYRVSSKRMKVKSVQVIPWQLADASFTHPGYLATSSCVLNKIFVANLHGMITAEGLARILNDVFGGVVSATLDTDKSKYPIGSGRVAFSSTDSHMKAICAGTVEIRTAKFNRQIKIDPYLEDSVCCVCGSQLGPYFCRDLRCFSYFCASCWQWQHSDNTLAHHVPMMRPARSSMEDSL